MGPVTGSKVQRNIIISHPDGGKAHNERLRGRTDGGAGPKLVETDMDYESLLPPDGPALDGRASAQDAGGQAKRRQVVVGDPLFVDPAGGDFSFRPDSPALNLGIEPLDVSKMGRRDKRANSPTYSSEDRMQWFQDAKFGMFIHFGVDRRASSTRSILMPDNGCGLPRKVG